MYVTADCSNTKALWADLTKYKAVWRETWQQDRDDFQQAHFYNVAHHKCNTSAT